MSNLLSIDWKILFERFGIHSNDEFNPLFYIGPIPFSIYGFFFLAGFLFACLFIYLEWKYKKHPTFHLIMIFAIGAIVGIFGARWWYLAFNPSDFHSFYDLFALQAGRSILGSIFFGTLALWLYSRKFIPEIEWAEIFSIILPNILLAQAIGRWGNFYDYNVYGQPIGELIQPIYDQFGISIYYQKDALGFLPDFISSGMLIWDKDTLTLAYRQPLFLYESLATFVAWIIITFFMKKSNYFKKGTHGAMYFVFYGLIRASMELFRDPLYVMSWGDFPTSFYLSLIILVTGITLFIYFQWKKDLKFLFQICILNLYLSYKLFKFKL